MDFYSFWTVWLIEGFASFSLSVLEPIKSWVKQKFSQTHIYSGNCSGIPKKDRFKMILCKKSLKTLLCFVFAPPNKTINIKIPTFKGDRDIFSSRRIRSLLVEGSTSSLLSTFEPMTTFEKKSILSN